MLNTNLFFVVYSPTGRTSPTVSHFEEGPASREAQRLAQSHPGQKFFVMQAVHGYVREDPLQMIAVDPAQVPF